MIYWLLRINVLLALSSLGGIIYLYVSRALSVHAEVSSKKELQSQLVILHQKIKGLFDSLKNEHLEIKDSGSFKEWIEENEEQDRLQKRESFVMINRLLRKAELATAKDDIENAEKYLVKAISLDENNNEVNRNLAFIYLKQEKYNKAELLYTTLIENGIQEAVIYSNLGLCLYQQDKLSLAARIYEKALEIEPLVASRHLNLALVYKKMNDPKNHLDHLELAVKLSPKNLDYLFLLTETYLEYKLREKALLLLETIFNLEPYNERAKEIKRAIYNSL